jgi:hypothetical protein
MKNAGPPLGIAILLAFMMSCDNSFNPSAPFQPRMVVYSILSNVTDTQYVRVYTSYNPPNNDPSQNQTETSVTDAQVSITQEGGAVYTLRPLVVNRLDTSRYASSIGAYYAYPFRPARGKKYTLTVSSPAYGLATATTTFPKQGDMLVTNQAFFQNPWGSSQSQSFGVYIALAPEARAFLVRYYVDYLSPQVKPGVFIPKRYEVPVKWIGAKTFMGLPDYDKWIYPVPLRRTSPPNVHNPNQPIQYDESVAYQTAAFVGKLHVLYCFTEGFGVRFTGSTFYLIQFDEPLWNYYNVANGFRDPYSVRIDEASYANIKGGFGVFGSSSVDSTANPVLGYMPPPAGTRECK